MTTAAPLPAIACTRCECEQCVAERALLWNVVEFLFYERKRRFDTVQLFREISQADDAVGKRFDALLQLAWTEHRQPNGITERRLEAVCHPPDTSTTTQVIK